MYGVTAYNCWKIRQGDDEVYNIMKTYHEDHYANIPVTHKPPRNPPTRRENIMANAMDELNLVLMSIQGITPQEAANRMEKQMEEEEVKAQEASKRKVMGWLKNTNVE
jgi:hypothetical protein